jgi:hypothetical protein
VGSSRAPRPSGGPGELGVDGRVSVRELRVDRGVPGCPFELDPLRLEHGELGVELAELCLDLDLGRCFMTFAKSRRGQSVTVRA